MHHSCLALGLICPTANVGAVMQRTCTEHVLSAAEPLQACVAYVDPVALGGRQG